MVRHPAFIFLYLLLLIPAAGFSQTTSLDIELARRELRNGNHAEALRRFRTIIEEDAGYIPEAHRHMARIFVDLGDDQQAVRHFGRALNSGPFAIPDDRVRTYHELARQHLHMDRMFAYEQTMYALFEYNDEFTGSASASRRANIEQVFIRQSLARALELYRLTPGPFAAAHYEFGMHLLRSGRDDSLQHLLFYLLDTYSLAIEYYRRIEPRYTFIDLYRFTDDIRQNRQVNEFLDRRNVYWAVAYLGDAMYFYGGGGGASTRARELWQFVSRQAVAGDAAEYAARQLAADRPVNPGPPIR
ncbi:MAG: hypothetical protein EA383_09065 [Spirochaetaceae bacterium]|nr:MAG: hypothetical protein EA383_09065 [Spirochaetaceae bacterium]